MHVAEVTAVGGEVVVRIRAANVNPTDLSGRSEHALRGKVVLAP